MNDANDRIPDVLLERYRLGELPPAQRARIERRLTEDVDLADRLLAIEQSDEAIRRDYPPDQLGRNVRTRAGQHQESRPPSRVRGIARWAVPAAMAATIAVVVLRPDAWRARTPEESGDRPKGAAAAMVIYRNRDAGSEMLRDNDVARAGDVIRVGYRVADAAYGAILSEDGRGAVTRHLPPAGPESIALKAGETVLLDEAFELDDAPRFERFYFVTAPAPFSMGPVVDAVRRTAAEAQGEGLPALMLPPSLSHTTLSLRKDPRP